MRALMELHPILLSTPVPVTEDCSLSAWRCFPGCIGALDGIYIEMRVRLSDQPRYRSRKGAIATNVLAACDTNMLFTYALVGWEGSTVNGLDLKDAIIRPNDLRVPKGNYYLCDNGYTNGEGFLTPYRDVRYHLKEWGEGRTIPQDYQEYFNMKHSKARNIIERIFGNLKSLWAVLRSPAYYIIMACLLLNNFIRNNMAVDPFDGDDVSDSDDENDSDDEDNNDDNNDENEEYIETVETSSAWTAFQEIIAHDMYNQWLQARG